MSCLRRRNKPTKRELALVQTKLAAIHLAVPQEGKIRIITLRNTRRNDTVVKKDFTNSYSEEDLEEEAMKDYNKLVTSMIQISKKESATLD